jgi:glycosyltransferase involved in cell wall biosynthesis
MNCAWLYEGVTSVTRRGAKAASTYCISGGLASVLASAGRTLLLSFVIPTRNQAPYIRECIDSCLAQDVPDSEILVLDGASTDGTQDILASYGDKLRWRSQKDRGQSDAINQGIAMAKGDLIAWINSDDYYASPDVLRRVLAEFAADPHVDIVYGDGLRVDIAGKPIGPYHAAPYVDPATLVACPLTFVLQPCLVFKRSLYLAVGGLDETLHYTMDYDLWLRMFPAAKAVRKLDAVIASARYHSDAKSVAAMGKQIREAYEVKRAHARRLGLGRRDRARMLASMGKLWAYWLAVRSGLKSAT